MARGSRIQGITIEINGDTSKLQNALKGVNGDLNTAQTGLRDLNKLLKLDPTNITLLKQKQKLLGDAIAATKEKLDKEKEALRQLREADQTPEVITQQDKLEREVFDTEQQLKSLKGEMKSFGSVASQQLKAVGDKLKGVADKIGSVGRTLSTHVTVPIVAAFGVASNAASDYEENLNKIDVAFGDSSDAVTEWANNALDSFGLSKVAASDAVSSFGALSKGIGLAEGDAAEMSTTLAGLSADLGSYFNTSNEEAATALEGIFTGESEALKKFGVIMNETNLKQFAEDSGLVYSEMSEAEKVQLRYNYVLSKTTDAQGDYARTSDGTANSMKTFKAALEDAATALGTQLLPIITPIIRKITEIIEAFGKLSPTVQKVIVVIGLIAAAIGPVLVIVGTVIGAIGTIITTVGTLSGALAAAGGASAVFGGAIAAITGPIGIAIAAIAAIIAVGVLLYKNWDNIKKYAKQLFDSLKATFTNIKNTLTTIWNNIKTTIANAWKTIKTNVTTAVNNVRTTVTNVFNAVRSFVSNIWNGIRNTISNVVNRIKNSISSGFNAAKNTATNVFNSIKTAISDKFTAAKNKVSSLVGNIKSALSFSGVKDKVSSLFGSIKNTISDKMSSAKNLVSNAVSTIKGKFPLHMGKIFSGVKLPHFRISGGSIPWGIGGQGVKPSVSIDWYKKGAIFTKPTLFSTPNSIAGVGEAGAEAVLPLSELWAHMEAMGQEIVNGVTAVNNPDVMYRAMTAAFKEMSFSISGREFARILREYGV